MDERRMNGWTDEQTDGQMDGWVNEWMDTYWALLLIDSWGKKWS